MKGQHYTKEFRESAIQLAMNSDEKKTKIAQDLGINDKTLYHWIRMYKKQNNITTDDRRNIQKMNTTKETANDELIRLRRENKLLKQERDILKKATAYFAKETL